MSEEPVSPGASRGEGQGPQTGQSQLGKSLKLGLESGRAVSRARLLISRVTSAPHRGFLGLSFPISQMEVVAGPSRIT